MRSFLPFVFLLTPSLLFAQQLNTNMWIPNGPVHATVQKNNTIYIGGGFDDVGPPTGHISIIDSITGLMQSNTPVVNGTVYCAVPDSMGGWFIGGNFTMAGTYLIKNLVHINASGQVVPTWMPEPDGEVRCMVRLRNRLFIAGIFTSLHSNFRGYAACVDTATGVPDYWEPNIDSTVYCMTEKQGVIYMGGSFTFCGGALRDKLARVDTSLGFVLSYPSFPNLDFNYPFDGNVYSIHISGSKVYVGGAFTTVLNNNRNHLASIDMNTGLTSWNPNPNGNVYTISSDPASGMLYTGGAFTVFGFSNARTYLARFDLATHTLQSFSPQLNGAVHALTVADTVIYAGGDFTTVASVERKRLAGIGTNNGMPITWDPHLNGRVNTLLVSGGKVFAGGAFTSTGGVTRNNLAALDLTTGQATFWDPDASGKVFAMELQGSTLFLGGAFTTVSNQTRQRLAAVDITSGGLLSFSTNVNGSVRCLQADGNTLYIGGYFSMTDNKPRNNLAAISISGDSVTNFDPNVNGTVNSIIVSGNKLYAGGYFTVVRNFTRNRIACVDVGTSIPTTWNPNANDAVYSLALYGDKIFAGGTFTSIGGASRAYIARLDTVGSTATSWNPGANNYVLTLFVNGDTLLAGGEFTVFDAQTRVRAAQYQLLTNSLSAWNPSTFGPVQHISSYSDIIFTGGVFENIDYYFHPNFAAYYQQLPQGAAENDPGKFSFSVYPNPASSVVACRYTLPENAFVKIELYDLGGRLLGTLFNEMQHSGEHTARFDLDAGNGIYFLKIYAGEYTITQKIVIAR